MNVLVIGGNGFIGSHLVDHLLDRGFVVRVFDVSHERYRKPIPNVDYRISTLDNTPDLFEALLDIDIVFHLASTSVPSSSNIDTTSDVKLNLFTTLNILNIAVKLGIKRLVYFSSGGAVYGNPLTDLISEEHPLNPISSYGIVKVTTEMYLSLYQRLYDLKPLIIRASNPYGPRQNHFVAQGVISTFLKKIQNNESLTIFGDGNSTKDYIYINDLIDLSCDLCFNNAVGIYNLGSSTGVSVNQIIDQMKLTTGKNPELHYINKKEYDVDSFVLDTTKMSSLLGSYTFTPMKDGILSTWDWIQQQSTYLE